MTKRQDSLVFFECINNQHVADALFETAQKLVIRKEKRRGFSGPMSFSLYDTCGLLCNGYDSSPVILLSYNPDYYNSLISGAGFSKAIDWYAFYGKSRCPYQTIFLQNSRESTASAQPQDRNPEFKKIRLLCTSYRSDFQGCLDGKLGSCSIDRFTIATPLFLN